MKKLFKLITIVTLSIVSLSVFKRLAKVFGKKGKSHMAKVS